ncbi:MAG: antibiotic biosynthesis monooxygenase family protein [Paracoccaceae bacterium]
MSVVVMLTLKTKPEAFEGLKEGLSASLVDTCKYEGCLGVYAAACPDTHTITLYERWEKPEDQQAYIAWRTERGEMNATGEALREPPIFQTLQDVFA